MTNKCPLCSLDLTKEKVFAKNGPLTILRTKKLKGHKERIMVVYNEHVHSIPFKDFEAAFAFLIDIGRKVFKYTPKFIIMDNTFASINEHWHLVATDLDPKADDFEQILATKWLEVIDNRNLD